MRIKDIRDFQRGEEFNLTALVKKVSEERDRNSNPYLRVELQDATGVIPGVVWNNVEVMVEVIRQGNVVDVSGKVNFYRGEIQLSIERASLKHDFQLEEIYPAAPLPIPEMERELNKIITSIKKAPLQGLVQEIIIKSEYHDKFLTCPAAKKVHHACIGGLLYHTLTVVKILDYIAGTYPMLDRDILITGGLLHDIGKLEELEIQGGFRYTNIGKLAGHIYLGAEIVEKFAPQVKGLNEKDVLLIKHIILSHHGTLEHGSPVIPKTPEAIAVHHVENMDAKLNHSINLITSHIENSSEGAWTEYSYAMKGEIFIPERAFEMQQEGDE